MTVTDPLDILTRPVPVQRTTASHPRVLVVVAALVGAGVLAAAIVVAAAFAFVAVAESEPPCSIQSPCADLSLEEVEQRSNLRLPDATVVESYRAGEVFGAEVVVPAGGAPDFHGHGYGVVGEPGVDWTDELDGRDLEVIGYYAASGNGGLTVGDLLHARNEDGSETIRVEVRTSSP